MPKRQTNNLRWKAELLVIKTGTDGNDRPTTVYEFKRPIFYEELGVTSQEKYLSQQAKTDVVRRIKVRWDKSITEKLSALKIDSLTYNITRIYTNPDTREMELSLAYVD
ncbi:phage head-tail joining protein [Enterococcus faecium]|uniref:phage head closure protein n=1 Tax=Enterococcus faecium TaxID=1352 RepID=UPI001368F247|nr:phage head closure protein [Enterococcus faecium]NAL98821.1 phage head-tail joining protein [Enterococcus faecium]NAM11879.1 phage head-tail joining protein [Enterococcus faecium]NAM27198.1 phage head-tail joining protein [Enterococcus faecium]NAM35134.1 phage head-tail joining protein [Enterococcus faecium]NAM43283.1 phage head-tail joining protein [Enterococcus faecium]